MKKIHMNKLGAVLEMKFRTLFSKNLIIMPLFSIGITLVMKIFYQSMGGQGEGGLSDMMNSLVLGLGAGMNISMTGVLCTAMSLAEEKEKHTLRALMTSSVSGTEFFLGSYIPTVALMTVVNAVLVIVAGIRLPLAGWAAWLGISLLCAAASSVLGMIFGICAKDQVAASTLSTVPLLVLMMVPIFGTFQEGLGKISKFLFTGVMQNTAEAIVKGETGVDIMGIAVILVQIVLAVLAFLLVYRRNGYDAE